MTTRLLAIACSGLLLFSCSQDPIVEEVVEVDYVDAEIPDVDLFNYDTLKGMYIGDFGGSDIRLIINYMSQENAIGYNIHKGLQRNLTGKVKRSGDSVTVILNEPGDHEYDGRFELLFIGQDTEPTGKWIANDSKIPSKEMSLKRLERPENMRDDQIDASNFHQFFSDCSDTLGQYSFKDDGLVIFQYYPGGYEYADWEDRGRANQNQLEEIQGTWSLHGDRVDISWAKNSIFPSSTMSYQVKYDEYESELYREGNSIYQRFYP